MGVASAEIPDGQIRNTGRIFSAGCAGGLNRDAEVVSFVLEWMNSEGTT